MMPPTKYLVTLAVIVVAAVAGWLKYRDYVTNPWTRDGQVRANIIQVTPRVSGPIVELPIVDNQPVKAGDLLFKIDQRTYRAALDQAQAQYDQAVDQLDSLDKQIESASAAVEQGQAQVEQAAAQLRSAQAAAEQSKKQLDRYATLLRDGYTPKSTYDQQYKQVQVDDANNDRATAALSQARSALTQAEAERSSAIAKRGAKGEQNAQLRNARAALRQAKLNLEFTEQRASVDGFVTNLSLRLGSQANAGAPVLALVDRNSFWIDAYFRESVVGTISVGDIAFVTLMSYPANAIPASVDSIAWGIAKQDGSTAQGLLPNVQPSFEWIRLAQRIPVRVVLAAVPDNVQLRVGTTASIVVRTGTAASAPPPKPVPAPLR